jgi:hypothetical protein
MDKTKIICEHEGEAIKFLERDFNQCFQQIRHYDVQLFDIVKFVFTGYITLIGIAFGIYRYGIEKNLDIILPAKSILIIGYVLGVLLMSIVVRNRVYFVVLNRYINEQRHMFLKVKPFGFENRSKMYDDYTQPPFFNWRSSHSWFLYIIASLNSTLLAAFIFITIKNNKWIYIMVMFFISSISQLAIGIIYLKTREKKTASEAVFGK